MTARFRAVLRTAAHALTAAAITLLILLPRSRYDWVGDVAPGIDPARFEDGGGNRGLVLTVLVGAALLVELVAVASARTRRERIVASALTALIALAALLRALA